MIALMVDKTNTSQTGGKNAILDEKLYFRKINSFNVNKIHRQIRTHDRSRPNHN